MKKIIKSLSYSNVMATIAVFLTIGGAAFAVAQAPKGSVTGRSIRNNTVTGRDVRNESLTGLDVREDTLQGVTPAGPAGGSLAGAYPNPVLALNSVNTDEIADGAIGSGKISEGAVTGVKIGLSAVDSSKIQDGSVDTNDIHSAAVGVEELADDVIGGAAMKGMLTVTSTGVVVNAGSPKSTSVQCPPGRQMIGGGYSWQKDEPNSIIVNAPSDVAPNTKWDVRGMVDTGSNTLFAWANCLLP